jgi:hypothetical protein
LPPPPPCKTVSYDVCGSSLGCIDGLDLNRDDAFDGLDVVRMWTVFQDRKKTADLFDVFTGTKEADTCNDPYLYT